MMASIEKLYGTKEEYKILHQWCEEERPELLKNFYPLNDYIPEQAQSVVANFSTEDDMWLLVNCPFEFVIDRIIEQHNMFRTDPHNDYLHVRPVTKEQKEYASMVTMANDNEILDLVVKAYERHYNNGELDYRWNMIFVEVEAIERGIK